MKSRKKKGKERRKKMGKTWIFLLRDIKWILVIKIRTQSEKTLAEKSFRKFIILTSSNRITNCRVKKFQQLLSKGLEK